MASVMIRSALCALLLMNFGCYSVQPASHFTDALDVLCSIPDVRSAGRVEVIGRTTGILQLPALRDHFNPNPITGDDIAALTEAEEKLLQGFASESFVIPHESACNWQKADDRQRYSDLLRIELSFVVPKDTASNPSAGIFARVSDGGRPGADFYWVPIDERGRLSLPVKLTVDDG